MDQAGGTEDPAGSHLVEPKAGLIKEVRVSGQNEFERERQASEQHGPASVSWQWK